MITTRQQAEMTVVELFAEAGREAARMCNGGKFSVVLKVDGVAHEVRHAKGRTICRVNGRQVTREALTASFDASFASEIDHLFG